MKTNTQIQQHVPANRKRKPSVSASEFGAEVRKGVVTLAGHVYSVNAFNVRSFAESFLKSPLANAMLERGEPLKFFLPIRRSDCAEWGGVDITIAGVTKERIAREEREAHAPIQHGNGYSDNPHGPLKPGDYGVHSWPRTTELMKNGPGKR